ncbi:MAG: hypothetical protein QW076_02460 [Candidatus Anstonellales archaeon]
MPYYNLYIPTDNGDYYDEVEASNKEEAIEKFLKRMPKNDKDSWSEDFISQFIEEIPFEE